jgi:hypothetical protein
LKQLKKENKKSKSSINRLKKIKIKKENFYKNEYAKEEELKALKKQYPAMFANNRAS